MNLEYVASDDDSGVVLDEVPSPEVPADPDPAPWPEEFREDDDRVIVRLGVQTTKASAKLFDRAELPGDLQSLRLERK